MSGTDSTASAASHASCKCPLYGLGLTSVGFAGQGGNRCALVTDAHAPCIMETQQSKAPDWLTCPRNTPESMAFLARNANSPVFPLAEAEGAREESLSTRFSRMVGSTLN